MLLDYCCRCCGFTLIKRHGHLPVNTPLHDTWVNTCSALHAVLQNLSMCMLCFYSLYYIVVSLCIGILRVDEVDSLLAPFDYTTQPSWQSPKYLVSVISTEVTYTVGGLIFAWIVEDWVWDYAITVTLLHIGLTVAVMADFPSAEHWWIALGSGLLMMIFGGQLLAYRLFRNHFVHPADLQDF
ncbi:transmembrane protein 244 isoform X1 [Triplophysa rosa]|uniref:transmembrane protein 244 isoform X1 n=1 Tax=Triplophysa rosa TaxID=992332 RepID=UPI0025460490|nr:transmembrane protein 244 isoform X1 [Triplophysa rosa]XP_057209602.1 transmembrane protein 244 isoform X1 [Triplophysa rosa]